MSASATQGGHKNCKENKPWVIKLAECQVSAAKSPLCHQDWHQVLHCMEAATHTHTHTHTHTSTNTSSVAISQMIRLDDCILTLTGYGAYYSCLMSMDEYELLLDIICSSSTNNFLREGVCGDYVNSPTTVCMVSRQPKK